MTLPDLNKLCTPAQLYLLITLFSLVVMIFQNNGTHSNVLCVGNYECYNSPNKSLLVFIKLIYISFWTFVLQMICKGGYKSFSWFLVLLPIVLFMLLLIFALGPWTYKGGFIEGMENPDENDEGEEDKADYDGNNGSSFVEGMTNLNQIKTPKDGANYVAERVDRVSLRSQRMILKMNKIPEDTKNVITNLFKYISKVAKTSAAKVT